ncbi:MAG TPA: host attachment protein [Vitreimonas sp.]|nr:host attachment protein [Vitreimonas sp.]
MKSPRTWVVVVDAHSARFFERSTRAKHVVEKSELALTAPPRPKQRARAPRVHESVGPMRHRIEARTPPRVAQEKVFLEAVAGELKRHADANAFDQLIISAPPRAVGMLKPVLAPSVRTRLKDFWTKDLVHEAAEDIERRLFTLSE